MDLSTTYLGLSLPHPLMPGASPLVDDLDMVKRLEDAGAAAIVMHSLFEEQISGERAQLSVTSKRMPNPSRKRPRTFLVAMNSQSARSPIWSRSVGSKPPSVCRSSVP